MEAAGVLGVDVRGVHREARLIAEADAEDGRVALQRDAQVLDRRLAARGVARSVGDEEAVVPECLFQRARLQRRGGSLESVREELLSGTERCVGRYGFPCAAHDGVHG